MNKSRIFQMIFTESMAKNSLSVKELCSLAGVSRSGYYRWCGAAETRKKREEKDFKDFLKIKEAYEFRGYDKGHRGIYYRLLRMGIRMNHKKILRLMNKYGLYCPIRKANPQRRIARALKTDSTSPNHVNREFRQYRRKILLTDITYIRISDDFYYLSVIKDAYTMQILAYELSDSLEVDFVLKTVEKLIEKESISLTTETIIHSDQGSHYTSIAFRKLLEDAGFRQSMSRRGNCWDNAPQESFFGHMKEELKPYQKEWKTYEDLKIRIDDWIDYYNNDRYQSSLLGMSPNEYDHYLLTNKLPKALSK